MIEWHTEKPPKSGFYLVTARLSTCHQECRYVSICTYDTSLNGWQEIGKFGVHKIKDYKIVAWAELPAPFEGDCEWANKEV